MPASQASREAFQRANRRAFGRGSNYSNARANAEALKRMSLAERETGMTGEELREKQHSMKADYYARQAKAA